MIRVFRNEHSFLSNFYDSSIVIDGILYLNAESAYQAHKNPRNRKAFMDMTGGRAKALGSKVELREDWDEVKDEVMEKVVRAKFKQSLSLRKRLLDTMNQKLVEGNMWHDNYWGDCYCDRCKKIEGQNKLGKILMQIREEYKVSEKYGIE